MNIYVSNISFHTTENTLVEMFSMYGKVADVQILNDPPSGITKRFGFVEMHSAAEAFEAIKMLDGKEIQGRSLRVSQARERFSRSKKR